MSEGNHDDKDEQKYEKDHPRHPDAAFQQALDLTSVSTSPVDVAFGKQTPEDEGTGNGAANQPKSSDKQCFYKAEVRNLHHPQPKVNDEKGNEYRKYAKPFVNKGFS
ncbi:hypothetical protein SDC9_106712 [bioreactor metagenome]|uniref:Uncharacterized protein n=1 Tax=bioreactor metagenome TaxID=1076179 RepID=A0A645B468_9ZZZZ